MVFRDEKRSVEVHRERYIAAATTAYYQGAHVHHHHHYRSYSTDIGAYLFYFFYFRVVLVVPALLVKPRYLDVSNDQACCELCQSVIGSTW